MSREYYNSLRLNLGSDFFSNLLQLAVDGMIHIVHDVRLPPINQRPQTLSDSKNIFFPRKPTYTAMRDAMNPRQFIYPKKK